MSWYCTNLTTVYDRAPSPGDAYWLDKKLPKISLPAEIHVVGCDVRVTIGNVVLTEPAHEFPSDALLLQVMLIAG